MSSTNSLCNISKRHYLLYLYLYNYRYIDFRHIRIFLSLYQETVQSKDNNNKHLKAISAFRHLVRLPYSVILYTPPFNSVESLVLFFSYT